MQDQNRINLLDENGNDVPFEHLMTLEHEGNHYILLEAVQDMEDCMEGEAIILKVIQDEGGEDTYVTIEDEQELNAVFAKCIAAMEEQDAEDEQEYGEYEDDSEDDDE